MAAEGIRGDGGSAISLDLTNIRPNESKSANNASNKNATPNIASHDGDVIQSYLDKITAGKRVNISL